MNHLLNMLDGFASILENHLRDARPYVHRRNGFYVDQLRLRKDVIAVNKDLRKSLLKYGEQSGSRGRYEQKR